MTNYINSRSRRGVPLRPAEEIPIVDGRAGAGRGPDGMTSYISRNTRGVPPAEEVPIVMGSLLRRQENSRGERRRHG